MQPIIIAEHLSKTYKSGKIEVPALRDVTFSIDPGEFVSVVGPSGSGKSTLFYILGGLARATSGKLFIDGIDFVALNDAERTRMRKARIGFVFQKFNLLPTLTARGNIQIGYDIAERRNRSILPIWIISPTCSASRAASITGLPNSPAANSSASRSPAR